MRQKRTFGTTWWGERWIAVLESFGWANRLQRGRSYARSGHVVDLKISPGKVAARVQGSRPQPYQVSIAVAPVSPGLGAGDCGHGGAGGLRRQAPCR